MIEITEMTDKDIDAVCSIEEECFSMPWRREDFLQMIENDHMSYLVVKDAGEIFGGAGIREIVGDIEITNVAIKAEYRNQGYGHMLLQALLEKGRELGGKAFTLEVRISNVAAISVYKDLGFLTEGVRKNFYEKPVEDALIMWKRD
ncbi:MAG: ribosomal protein S18-alanine N-acetyltransferase [Lachnospiraceae bacterium]|nr:ribosomal protein S18-alanine N-acetyltransferase [Lachnospiraceae bacterium]